MCAFPSLSLIALVYNIHVYIYACTCVYLSICVCVMYKRRHDDNEIKAVTPCPYFAAKRPRCRLASPTYIPSPPNFLYYYHILSSSTMFLLFVRMRKQN